MSKPTKPEGLSATAKTGAKQLDPYKWKPGQSGNPKGRPQNAKQKLSDSFLADMLEAWQAKGKEAIDRVIEERPHEFIKAVGAIVPKDINVNTNAMDELTDDDVAALISAVRSAVLGGAPEKVGSGSETPSRH
jgi:hypothetical protein